MTQAANGFPEKGLIGFSGREASDKAGAARVRRLFKANFGTVRQCNFSHNRQTQSATFTNIQGAEKPFKNLWPVLSGYSGTVILDRQYDFFAHAIL